MHAQLYVSWCQIMHPCIINIVAAVRQGGGGGCKIPHSIDGEGCEIIHSSDGEGHEIPHSIDGEGGEIIHCIERKDIKIRIRGLFPTPHLNNARTTKLPVHPPCARSNLLIRSSHCLKSGLHPSSIHLT